jgi:hypothetical protein
MSGAISTRTVVRDAVVQALRGRLTDPQVRMRTYDISQNYLTAQECKRFPTYCVVVSDESPGALTLTAREFQMVVLLVLYVRDEDDTRAVLDAVIEDVYETMLTVQRGLGAAGWKLVLESLSSDEGTTIANPHAQCVQRWICHHSRAAV